MVTIWAVLTVCRVDVVQEARQDILDEVDHVTGLRTVQIPRLSVAVGNTLKSIERWQFMQYTQVQQR